MTRDEAAQLFVARIVAIKPASESDMIGLVRYYHDMLVAITEVYDAGFEKGFQDATEIKIEQPR